MRKNVIHVTPPGCDVWLNSTPGIKFNPSGCKGLTRAFTRDKSPDRSRLFSPRVGKQDNFGRFAGSFADSKLGKIVLFPHHGAEKPCEVRAFIPCETPGESLAP
jgi:hypothetical protein